MCSPSIKKFIYFTNSPFKLNFVFCLLLLSSIDVISAKPNSRLLLSHSKLQTMKRGEFTYESKDGPWRVPLITWALEVCKHFDIDNRVVGYSVSLFDRFLDRSLKKIADQDYTLYFAASLMIAIKVNHGEMRADTMATMGVGRFTYQELIDVEKTICESLRWRLYDVTIESYLDVFIDALNIEKREDLNQDQKYRLYVFVESLQYLAGKKIYRPKRIPNYEAAADTILQAMNLSTLSPTSVRIVTETMSAIFHSSPKSCFKHF